MGVNVIADTKWKYKDDWGTEYYIVNVNSVLPVRKLGCHGIKHWFLYLEISLQLGVLYFKTLEPMVINRLSLHWLCLRGWTAQISFDCFIESRRAFSQGISKTTDLCESVSNSNVHFHKRLYFVTRLQQERGFPWARKKSLCRATPLRLEYMQKTLTIALCQGLDHWFTSLPLRQTCLRGLKLE